MLEYLMLCRMEKLQIIKRWYLSWGADNLIQIYISFVKCKYIVGIRSGKLRLQDFQIHFFGRKWMPGHTSMKKYPLANIILYACLFTIIIVYILLNNLAGYTFPIPWADEGIFLWQSISIQENNTLIAPQLNPTRPLLLMPPGYMIFTGVLFKLIGFSLNAARHFKYFHYYQDIIYQRNYARFY